MQIFRVQKLCLYIYIKEIFMLHIQKRNIFYIFKIAILYMQKLYFYIIIFLYMYRKKTERSNTKTMPLYYSN